MKLLSSIISASHFFENAYALTDVEVSAFGCREGVYYQYEKVASNGGIAINQRASGMFLFLDLYLSVHFRRKQLGWVSLQSSIALLQKRAKMRSNHEAFRSGYSNFHR